MAALWASLGDTVRGLITTHPLALVAAVLFFEELGVPSPIPGDFMMLLAGIQVRNGVFPLWLILVIEEGATIAGSTGLFLLSRRVGRSLVVRYGWLLHLGPATLAKAEAAIRRQGGRAVLVGRLIPGLRVITPVAAGVLGMPLRSFVPALAVGGFVYLLVVTLLGMLVGPLALAFFERVGLPTGALVSLGIVLVGWYIVRSLKRELPSFAQGGAGAAVASRVDGLLAGMAALLFTNGVTGVAAFVLQFFGYAVPLGAEEVGSGLRLLLGWPVFLGVASLLGAFDEHLIEDRLRPRTRVALVAGVPLAIVLAVALPLVANHYIALGAGGGFALVAIEVVRWLTYGLALNELLPLDATLHEVPPRDRPAPGGEHGRAGG